MRELERISKNRGYDIEDYRDKEKFMEKGWASDLRERTALGIENLLSNFWKVVTL